MQQLEIQEKTHVKHKPSDYTGNLLASYTLFIKKEEDINKEEEEKEKDLLKMKAKYRVLYIK